MEEYDFNYQIINSIFNIKIAHLFIEFLFIYQIQSSSLKVI